MSPDDRAAEDRRSLLEALREEARMEEPMAQDLAELDDLEDEAAELAAFEADRPGDDEPADLATAAAWRQMRDRLPPAAPQPSLAPATPIRDRVWLPWAAAGLLFVLSLAMAWQIASMARTQGELAERIEALESPRGNVPLVYLDAVTRGEPGDATVAAGPVVLIVTPDDPAPGAAYEMTVETATGTEVWRGGGLTPSDHGTLRVSLPRLDRGTYRVSVRPEGGEEVVAGEYRLEVR